jgi:NAD(P)-dependent dehydrogenase (short-subunit alcohol dehydrogenase family)
VLVTGGSRGIGRAVCSAFARNGASIVVFYLKRDDAAADVVNLLQSMGCKARSLRVDITDHVAVQEAVAELESDGLRVDVLVNCAGIALDKTVQKLSLADWQHVIDTNLTGTFWCSKIVLGGMRERNYGRIINISSIIGQTGNIGQANYAAAKAGIIGLTKAMALETARYDVTVNAVCPGFIATDMVAVLPNDVKKQLIERIPKARFGAPEEVARAVTFLAARESGFITGTQLNVNGGMYL